MAILVLLRRVVGDVVLYIDCLPVYKGWLKGPAGIGDSSMADLWLDFWTLHARWPGRLEVRWIRSHRTA